MLGSYWVVSALLAVVLPQLQTGAPRNDNVLRSLGHRCASGECADDYGDAAPVILA